MWCFEKWMCKIEKIGSYVKINKKKFAQTYVNALK